MLQQTPEQRMRDLRNMLVAFGLSVILLLVWQVFFPAPAPQPAAQPASTTPAQGTRPQAATPHTGAPTETAQSFATVEEALQSPVRSGLANQVMQASINLMGGRLDYTTLTDYRVEQSPESPAVRLLSPVGVDGQYFMESGWLTNSPDLRVPGNHSQWYVAEQTAQRVVLEWNNAQGLRFQRSITLDEHYLFTITETVFNDRSFPVTLTPFSMLNREYVQPETSYAVLHEGLLGVFNQTLEEFTYQDLQDDDPSHRFTSTGGWLGVSDKYWISALLPAQNTPMDARLQHYSKDGKHRFQADLTLPPITVEAGSSQSYQFHLFSGPKKLNLLESYGQQLNVPLLDRAVDFGALYFITKPMFQMLHQFYVWLGNFGLAILLLTLVVRLLLFPLANQSYRSMAAMRVLAPKMKELREKHQDDPMTLNKEMMALYKTEKVNPMAGCLPLLLQIPVFFALYKVLFVTIEMRHAPFYGYLHDLSAPDPLTVLTLFGTLPWNVPAMLAFGLLPLLMCLTMMLQQKLQPAPADPTQAKMMKLFPFILLFVSATFPAGLVLYWTFNNILSILQQLWMNHRYDEERAAKRAARKTPRTTTRRGNKA